MALIGAKCPECGASLKISEKASGTLICPYCGSEYMVEQAITNITNVNNFNTNVKTNVSEVHNYAGATILGGVEKEFVIQQGVLKEYRGNSTTIEIPEGVLKINAKFNSFINKIILPASLVDYANIPFDKCEIDISKQPLLSVIDDRMLVYNNSEIYGFKDGYSEYHIPNGIAKVNVTYPEKDVLIPDSLTEIRLEDECICTIFHVENPRMHEVAEYDIIDKIWKYEPLNKFLLFYTTYKFVTPIDYLNEKRNTEKKISELKVEKEKIYDRPIYDDSLDEINKQKSVVDSYTNDLRSNLVKNTICSIFFAICAIVFFIMSSINGMKVFFIIAGVLLAICAIAFPLKSMEERKGLRTAIGIQTKRYNELLEAYNSGIKINKENKVRREKIDKEIKELETYLYKLENEL